MNQNIVLQKTSNGISELATRKQRLSPALRMVLILVDGQSSIKGLRRKAPGLKDLEKYLDELVEGSFVRDQSDFSPGSQPPETSEKFGSESLATMAKWQIIDMARGIIGGNFGERATARFMKIDDSPVAIRGALDECYQYVLLTIDDKKAELVKQKGLEILAQLELTISRTIQTNS